MLLLSLTLTSSGCASGTHIRNAGASTYDLGRAPEEVGQVQSSAKATRFQKANFGLVKLEPPVAEAGIGEAHVEVAKIQKKEPKSQTAKPIVNVGYLEEEAGGRSNATKIDIGAFDDSELDENQSKQKGMGCIREADDVDGVTGVVLDGVVAQSQPLALDRNFAPTIWTGVSIDEVRALAYEYHPVIARAQAKLDALRGRYLQKGLPNNPMVGINADDVNEGGRPGRWGVQFGRKVVRGGKRQSDQAIVCAEMEVATEELKVAQRKLDTDITTRFYDCMVAQEQLAMAERMRSLATRATELSRKLYAAEEVARSAVLQAELELEKAHVAAKRIENRHLWAKRQLAALLGREEIPTENVGGSIDEVSLNASFEATYDRLLKHSPELSVLFAEIERARRVASRQRLETVTDLTWQTTIQYDTVDDNLIGGFQLTWKIPSLNQNQGAIYEAERNVAVGQHTAEIKALDIRQRLSRQWQQYVDAQLQVDAFRNIILPKSQETLEILMKGYATGETELLEVLMVQRTFFQTQVAYLENVRSLSRQNARIHGMLLSDSLSQ